MPEKPDTKSIALLAETVKGHFEPKPLIIAERYYFYNQEQKPSESIAEYMMELSRYATHCQFRDHLNVALRDRLVCRLWYNGIKQRLLTETNLTFAKAVEVAQGVESAEQNVKKLRSCDVEQVQRVGSSSTVSRKVPKQQRKACYRCGAADHIAKDCRFKDAIYHRCKKKNDIAEVYKGGGSQGGSQGRQRSQAYNIKETAVQPEEQSSEFSIFSTQINHGYSGGAREAIGHVVGYRSCCLCYLHSHKSAGVPEATLLYTSTILSTDTGEQMSVAGRMEVEVVLQKLFLE